MSILYEDGKNMLLFGRGNDININPCLILNPDHMTDMVMGIQKSTVFWNASLYGLVDIDTSEESGATIFIVFYLKMGTLCSFELLLAICWTTRCYIPEDRILILLILEIS